MRSLRLWLIVSVLTASAGLGWATKPGFGLVLAGAALAGYLLFVHDWAEKGGSE